MLFKLSVKNIKKSFKNYAIYFLTLVLGIAIFYMFNSLDAQETMLAVSESTKMILKLMISMLSIISVFIAVILGFLIVYANNFLIKRRKKEFGIYMTLGMGRRKISKILLIETILIGIVSLIVGLLIGVFGSQLMSILTAKMFEVDMTRFEFVFSSTAMIKTIIYFGIMYLAVLLFNTITISKYKLIDLITAVRKNEKVKIKNTFLCIIVFLISISMLGWAYYTVTANFNSLMGEDFAPLITPVIMGCIGTFLFFWSMSGFVLKLVQSNKKVYLKNANMFVLRQINAKINTTVFSMTVICLMLFVTICILSSAISINNSFTQSLKELTPVDINISKINTINKEDKNEKYSIREILETADFDINNFKDITEVNLYEIKDITMEDTLGNLKEDLLKEFPMVRFNLFETIMKVSDYNKVARLYGNEEYSLNDNEYMITCDYKNMKDIRDMALNNNQELNIEGKKLFPKYKECQNGFIQISGSHVNLGIIIVPDNMELTQKVSIQEYLIANYNSDDQQGKQKIEDIVINKGFTDKLAALEEKGNINAITKILIYESSTGLSAMVTFIALYLGIIFLIASSAILALKELSESSDNKDRYSILRKIGADEKMINKALFMQIGIFFLIPLLLAAIHSIFGIQFALKILETVDSVGNLTKPIILTSSFIAVIYGGYFVATYLCSKNIIKD